MLLTRCTLLYAVVVAGGLFAASVDVSSTGVEQEKAPQAVPEDERPLPPPPMAIPVRQPVRNVDPNMLV